MKWKMKLFSKHDWLVVLMGVLVFECVGVFCINRLMFHPRKNTYDENLDGYMVIGTNDTALAARYFGPKRGIKVILYCHGNAEDLTSVEGRFDTLIREGYSVLTFDYPGYGLSKGSPTEKECYRSAHAAYNWLREVCGYAPEDILVLGYSIGSGPATELASTCPVGGLWIECGFMSAPRAVTRVRLLPIDPFPNVDHIVNVKCPIVIIHGTCDRIVPFSQGKKLYERAPMPKTFLPVEGADHHDFIEKIGWISYQDYLRRILKAMDDHVAK